jgi:hypothetical protein
MNVVERGKKLYLPILNNCSSILMEDVSRITKHLTLLLHILEVRGANLSPETGYTG